MYRLVAPASYVQGPEVLADPDSYGALAGERALLLGGETALSAASGLEGGLSAAGIEVAGVEAGVDACTFAGIEHLSDAAREVDADLVVGVGGGVALDTAKAIAHRAGTELATVPTVASTDAPCSRVAVVYDGAGAFEGYVHRDRNPELVLADTRAIASAPARFLRYGLGDAFATRFEAETAARTVSRNHAGGRPTRAALGMARRCYRTLAEHGEDALAAVERDAVTPAVERAVEAAVLLSGVGFESGGLAAAHAFTKGLSRAGSDAPHGVQVAFGTVAQLVLEDRDAEVLDDALSVYGDLGLSTSLAELGVADAVEEVAEGACREDTTMDNQPGEVTPAMAADALRVADALIDRQA